VLDIDVNNFDRLRIGLASSKKVRQWSKGEVKKAETINYRTLKPEKDGLFCEKIFGPTKDWECHCGKYKRVRFKGIVCERCGVEVTRAKVRRDRMGHIELAAPVSHIWYFKGVPSRLGYLLDIAPKDLEKVLYFAASIITSVNEDDREADMPVLRDELAADMDSLEAEMQQEIAATIENRDKMIARAKGEVDPEDGDHVDGEPLGADSIKKLEKECEQEIRDITEDYEDRRDLYSKAFETFQKLTPKMLIPNEALYREMKSRYGDYFRGGMGAEAIRDLLDQINLEELAAGLRTIIAEGKGQAKERATKRLKVVAALKGSSNHPSWMILDAIPVIPPDLRPMVQLDGGRFATSDLNDLYRRVINRNNRLKRLLDLGAPEIIVNNEKRMLQEAVDALFDNGRRGRPVTGPGNRPLKSIADMLKGKQGRFRQNLLGKRVDYSGRSVIVVGPELKLHQCGLPKTMALELFKPFVMKRLVDLDYAQNIKSAKRMVDRGRPVIWDVLEEVIRDHPVMLNRAPTLHRLGIQAFEPVLVEGKAIRIHPMVCTAFNADFDGDQMAVHVPISAEAQAEARVLMLSTNNIKSPATGRPVVTPTQDMIIGLFYLTSTREGMPGEGRVFASPHEATLAYDARSGLDLQASISVRLRRDVVEERREGKQIVAFERKAGERLETSVGRVFFNRALPEDHPFINYDVDKKAISKIVEGCANRYSTNIMVGILDELKRLGFHYATRAGLTVSVYDAKIPDAKQGILDKARSKVEDINQKYDRGLITGGERHRQIVEIWTMATDDVGEAMAASFDRFNPIYMMANSGARGNIKQIRQLAGMRGLMAKSNGFIVERPIASNFREGLPVLEYYLSAHGARKGLADTALRTADSGYLTRKLVDVAQDVIVRETDCGTDEGLVIALELESDEARGDSNLVGRCLLRPVADPATGEIIADSGDYLRPSDVDAIMAAGVEAVEVRAVMTCHAKHGICQKCYGWDLASSAPVEIGTAVGIIAAQSIGEPGTQLTMRTFHTGGLGEKDITGAERNMLEWQGAVLYYKEGAAHGLPRVTELFEARKNPKGAAVLSSVAGELSVEQEGDICRLIILDTTKQDGSRLESYQVPRARIRHGLVTGSKVAVGDRLTEGAVNIHELLRLKGSGDVLRYLVDEVQAVYRSQGVDINDKHIEVIARQMLKRVTVIEAGDTEFLPGQLVDRFIFETANRGVMANGGTPGAASPVLLGITKASLATDSYLSAASFQETTRVLTDAAIAGKEDSLLGLKENVIIGKLIPAATGMKRYRGVTLTYKGQKAEWDAATEDPLPQFAPDDLRELHAMLPKPSLRSESAELLGGDTSQFFADFDSAGGDDIFADVSGFSDKVFEPEVEDEGKGQSAEEGASQPLDAMEVSPNPEADDSPIPQSDGQEALSTDAGVIELGLPVRVERALISAGVMSIGELLNKGSNGLLSIEGLGAKSISEIRARLESAGHTLA